MHRKISASELRFILILHFRQCTSNICVRAHSRLIISHKSCQCLRVCVRVCAREYGQQGPAVLLEFDEKKAEISTLSRFEMLWRVAFRGADAHTRIVKFGGHGGRVAVVSAPPRKQDDAGVRVVARGATKMSSNTTSSCLSLGPCHTLGSRQCDAQGYVSKKRKRESKYQTYVSCTAAVEAAGGVHCVSFASTAKQVESIVGDAQHFVITPIQQMWPVNTEKQLRCLVYQLVKRNDTLRRELTTSACSSKNMKHAAS